MGRNKRPLYGVVASDSRSPRDGRFIEDLGRYEPLNEPEGISLKNERVLYWLEQGAQPTDTVRSILSKHGLMLALHMKRKGASDDEIWTAVEKHRSSWQEASQAKEKETAKDRRIAALALEETRANEIAAELRKKRAEVEAKAQAELEKARDAAAQERERAAEEARVEQESANVEQVKADSPEQPEEGAEVVADPVEDSAGETEKEEASPEPVDQEVVEPESVPEETPVTEASEPEVVAEDEAAEPDAKVKKAADEAPVEEAEASATEKTDSDEGEPKA